MHRSVEELGHSPCKAGHLSHLTLSLEGTAPSTQSQACPGWTSVARLAGCTVCRCNLFLRGPGRGVTSSRTLSTGASVSVCSFLILVHVTGWGTLFPEPLTYPDTSLSAFCTPMSQAWASSDVSMSEQTFHLALFPNCVH